MGLDQSNLLLAALKVDVVSASGRVVDFRSATLKGSVEATLGST
jgi:hypothetical protein